ncbi:MAG: PQQ-like beta-propeller repeat protein [Planctomycetes bacterium]|nr:PQQ-like beta-propeller repeat protein [Planctomycetota bacterium]
MRFLPLEHRILVSPLTCKQIQTRLQECTTASFWKAPRRGSVFVGKIHEQGFRLVPIYRGRSSFLPQFHGRCQPDPAGTGTRIDLQIVPNIALMICLLVVFSVLGILVYDKIWLRVVITTSANVLLATLLLFVGFWVAVDSANRRLLTLLEAEPAPVAPLKRVKVTARFVVSWILAAAVLATGIWLWWSVHSGRLTLSMRPAVDLVTIAWTTLGLLVIWLFTASGLSPVTQVRCLLLFFLIELGWSWTATVDRYGGDGRPLFAWRWQAKDDTVDTTTPVQATRPADPSVMAVDLRVRQIHDLPAFRGPHRDGLFHDVSLDPDWTRVPPQIVWQQPIGVGWSSYVMAGGYAVTQEQRGPDEAVVCYEVATGRECWEHRDQARFHEMMGGDGPRATPTLDEGDVYSLGATGLFHRLNGRDGRPVWTVNVITEANAPVSLFGLTGSPLIWDDTVIVNPGGKDASLVAYDKQTGQRRWAAGSSRTAYASPQAVRLCGRDQILAFNAEGLFAHAAEDGRILWSYPWVTPPEFNNVCQPVVWRDESAAETVFIASGYGKGCVLLEIECSDEQFQVTPRWQNTSLKVKFSSVVEHNGYVYGLDENILVCVDLRTGQRKWKGGRYGYGQLIRVESHLLVLTEDGDVVLCEATPEQHRELARLPVLNGRTWTHPALSGDTLLIRNDRDAACVKLPLSK